MEKTETRKKVELVLSVTGLVLVGATYAWVWERMASPWSWVLGGSVQVALWYGLYRAAKRHGSTESHR